MILGWLAAGVAMLLGVPQIVRLVRTRSTDGLSMLLWQAMFSINVGWAGHGLKIGAVNMIATNVVGLASTLTIMVLIMKARGLRAHRVLPWSFVGAAALVAIDLGLGSAAFGTAAVIPAVIANAGQSVELIRAPRVTGVAPLFLAGQVVNQALWFCWALLAGDGGTLITAPATGLIALFNLVWWAMRKAGLRPMFVRHAEPLVVPAADADFHSRRRLD